MKLSIVTINYNNVVGLKKTLDSVAGQGIHPQPFLRKEGNGEWELEHIIVDGGSTDGSVDIIRDYANAQCTAYGVKWVSERDKGIYNAMNKGIKMAIDGNADYIQILNSGDCLYSDTVVRDMVLALEEKKYPNIMYGNMIRDYGQKRNNVEGNRDKCLGQHEWTMLDFIKGTINHDPTYIKRELYEKYGLYDEELKIGSDWKWFVQAVVFGGEKPVYVPIDVTLFDVTGISETQLDKREAEREAELRKMLPETILKDYWTWHFPINQVKRLKRHHLWGLVYFMERVLFKLEKWGILK